MNHTTLPMRDSVARYLEIAGAACLEPHSLSADLQLLSAFVAWCPVPRPAGGGKFLCPETGVTYRVAKVPIGQDGRAMGGPLRPVTLALALQTARAHGGGVGLVLSPALGVVVFDVDLPADMTLQDPRVTAWLQAVGGVAHLSPGGHGLHALVRGTLPPGHPVRVQVAGLETEVYAHKGFVTLTTTPVPHGTSPAAPLPNRQAFLNALLGHAPMPRSTASTPSPRPPAPPAATPLTLMRLRKPEVGRLLDGQVDASTVKPQARRPDGSWDMSKVEYQLVTSLRYWLSGDRGQMVAALTASGFAALPCRVRKWAGRALYVENLVDRVLLRKAGRPTLAEQSRRPGYPAEVQRLMQARVAQLRVHGHTMVALHKLTDELIGQAVKGMGQDRGGLLQLHISLGRLAANVGGGSPDIRRRLETLRAAGVIAGLVPEGGRVRILLHTDAAGLLAAAGGPPPVVTVRKRRPRRPRLQGAPRRWAASRVSGLRDLTWVARAVLRDGATSVKKVSAHTGLGEASVRHQLRRLTQGEYVRRDGRVRYEPAVSWKTFLTRMVAQHRQLRAPYVAAWKDKLARRRQRLARGYRRAA